MAFLWLYMRHRVYFCVKKNTLVLKGLRIIPDFCNQVAPPIVILAYYMYMVAPVSSATP